MYTQREPSLLLLLRLLRCLCIKFWRGEKKKKEKSRRMFSLIPSLDAVDDP